MHDQGSSDADVKSNISTGHRVDNYVVERVLGSGGEGAVYLARDSVLGRQVALKVLRSDALAGTRGIEEARLVARLDHPNIVRIHHVKRQAGVWFVAMEYVDGGSLDERVRRLGQLSPTESLKFTAGVADALHHAHEVGVIHRDVKPHNLLVSRRGDIKLADFGLALVASDAARMATRSIVGTPKFLAPELWRGKKLTPACDIYSLGACLFFMLSGAPPFSQSTLEELRAAHIEEAPPIPSTWPSAVAELVAACLAKDPQERPTALELRKQIKALHRGYRRRQRATAPNVAGPREESPQAAPRERLNMSALVEGGKSTAERACLELPVLQVTGEELRAALSDDPQLVLLHGGYAALASLVARSMLEEEAAPLFVALRLVIDSSRQDILKEARAKVVSSTSRDADVWTLMEKECGDALPGTRSLIHLTLEVVPDLRQLSQLAELAERAVGMGLSVLVHCALPEAVGPVLDAMKPSEVTSVRQVVLPELRPDELSEHVVRWTRAATANRLRWAPAALAIVPEMLTTEKVPLDRLLHNAVMLAAAVGAPVITTWVVAGAGWHQSLLEGAHDVDARWRERPRSWPPKDFRLWFSQLKS